MKRFFSTYIITYFNFFLIHINPTTNLLVTTFSTIKTNRFAVLQGRMGYTRTGNGMDQRGWQDLASCSPMLAFPGEGQHHQHHHYGQHPSGALNYPPGPSMYHHHHNNTGSVLLQNVSLCAPPSLPPPTPTTSMNMGSAHVASSSSSSSSLSHYHHHSSSMGELSLWTYINQLSIH